MSLWSRNIIDLPVWEIAYEGTRVFFAICIALTLLTLTPVALRVYVRKLTKTKYRVEDYLVFVAFFLYIALFIVDLFVIFYGASGRPQSEVPPATVVASLQILVAQGLTYGSLMGCSKMSILFLYRRIFATKGFRRATHLGMFLVLGYALWAILAVFAMCVPVAANWDPSIPGAKCGNQVLALTMVGVLDAFTDAYILILPLPMVFRLKISMAKKISLAAVFGIALFSLAISICRTYFASQVVYSNFTQSRCLLDILTILEAGSSVVVASSLALGPVVQRAVSCCGGRWSSSQKYLSGSRGRTTRSKRKSDAFDLSGDFIRFDGESRGDQWPLNQSHQLELSSVKTDCRGPSLYSGQSDMSYPSSATEVLSDMSEEDRQKNIVIKREVIVEEEGRV